MDSRATARIETPPNPMALQHFDGCKRQCFHSRWSRPQLPRQSKPNQTQCMTFQHIHDREGNYLHSKWVRPCCRDDRNPAKLFFNILTSANDVISTPTTGPANGWIRLHFPRRSKPYKNQCFFNILTSANVVISTPNGSAPCFRDGRNPIKTNVFSTF